MITLWQGSANQWECDEMGHMNVRFYIAKAMEGLGSLVQAIHMPDAFTQRGLSTLIPVDQHIRFIHEVLPGKPLLMQGCVLEIGVHDVLLYQELRHSDGRPAAAFRTRLVHAESKSGKPFAWSTHTRSALDTLRAAAPQDTAPRSIQPDGASLPAQDATRTCAIALKAPRIGLGHIPAHHCDVHGRMRPEWFMGRISDSVPNLLYDWRKQVGQAAGSVRMGAAVLEYRLLYRAYPGAGDTFEAYSSLARTEEKFHSIIHWLVDPRTGKAWLTSEAVAVTFDLDTRKIIRSQSEHLEKLSEIAPKGLRV